MDSACHVIARILNHRFSSRIKWHYVTWRAYSISLYVEVFPRNKRRWGYRNIAQYRNFTYDDFRGGNDGAADSKTVGVQEWLEYWEKRFPRPIASLSQT